MNGVYVPPWICGWNRELASQTPTVCCNTFYKRDPAAVSLQMPQLRRKAWLWQVGTREVLQLIDSPKNLSGSCRQIAPRSCGTAGNFLDILCCPAPLLPIIPPLLWVLTCGAGESGVPCVVLFPSLPCRQYSAVLKEGLGSLLISQAFLSAIKEEKQRGACSALSGRAVGWRWCNGRARQRLAAAKLVMLCPRMEQQSAGGHLTPQPRPPHKGSGGEALRGEQSTSRAWSWGWGCPHFHTTPAQSWDQPGTSEMTMMMMSWWKSMPWNWGWQGDVSTDGQEKTKPFSFPHGIQSQTLADVKQHALIAFSGKYIQIGISTNSVPGCLTGSLTLQLLQFLLGPQVNTLGANIYLYI